MPLRELTIVVATADPTRFRTALTLASAQAALGGAARLFLDAAAVSLLAEQNALLAEALDLGVAILACQTGLAEAGLDLSDSDARIEGSGPIAVMASLGEDRLVVI